MAVNAARTKKKNCEVNNFCYFLGRVNFFFFKKSKLPYQVREIHFLAI